MAYLSEAEYKTKLEKIKRKNVSKQRHQKLKAAKNKFKTKRTPPSTSKLVLLGAVLLCIEIILFSQYAMLKTGDLSGLYAIVGIAATLASVILGYYFKSKAENTVGGIVYETALRHSHEEPNNEDDEDAVG